MLIEVVGAIIWRGERILIVQRPDSAEMGGLWEFPGGKVEPGESHVAALVRELREELDLEVEVGELYATSSYELPGRQVQLYFHTCCHVAGEPKLLWGQALRWVEPTELPRYCFPPADLAIIEALSATGRDCSTDSTENTEQGRQRMGNE